MQLDDEILQNNNLQKKYCFLDNKSIISNLLLALIAIRSINQTLENRLPASHAFNWKCRQKPHREINSSTVGIEPDQA